MTSKGKLTFSKTGKTNLKKRARDNFEENNDDNDRSKTATTNQSNESDSAIESNEVEDDEQNLADVSSSEEEEEEEKGYSEDFEDDSFPRKKKSKRSKHDDGSKEFSSAVSAILSSHLKAYDRNDPIMARNKKVIKQNEADKLELKAKKALLAEKKKLLDKARKRNILPQVQDTNGEDIRNILEKESKLRKIAQKGVVKLFNAILSTQVKTNKEVSEHLGGIKNKQEREQLITEVSKEKFLDLVKAAAIEE
ncbi:rRNA-processing protein RRP15 PWA37_000843 [Arxiozyma heterogenica]|uniref:Rrp15p-domain-containing protein n=1 Tax=Arxiozyma heterogenica TaxID=278026 RepID=A0AAN7W5V6_9SACH|nr:hypothetical protein RI543_000653 [Kazachstania heterogenica]